MKFIVVTGGVMSGIGKGLTASTIGLLLKNMGFVVTSIKIDPYLNIDAGTMSPFEHGECYVLNDGSEVDLDLGNYERFMNVTLSEKNSITTGKVYKNVIDKERNGTYLGKTVQTVPHITDEIKRLILNGAHISSDVSSEICIIEVGGTVGDIEGMPFIEALRQMQSEYKICFIHLGIVVESDNELKTKPIQTSIRELHRSGIFPHILCVRSPYEFSDHITRKLNLASQIPENMIICNTTTDSIYKVPLLLLEKRLPHKIAKVLDLNFAGKELDLLHYNHITTYQPLEHTTCHIVGKYTGSNDTYISIVRSLEHAAVSVNIKVHINIISDDTIKKTTNLDTIIKQDNCVIIPGGFGIRGTDEKIKVIRYCKQTNVPILGICFGFQLMIIDMCREFGISNATSEEFTTDSISASNNHNIISHVNPNTIAMGGTMRKGTHKCTLDTTSFVYNKCYKAEEIHERHRHRYEIEKDNFDRVIDKYNIDLDTEHIKLCGTSKHSNVILYEMLELTNHPYFVGCQFHPEFNSRLENPHGLFTELLRATLVQNIC